MSLLEIERKKGTFANRIYYTDTHTGALVERIVHDWAKVDETVRLNKLIADEYRPHAKGEFQLQARVPQEVILKWAIEDKRDGWIGDPEFDAWLWKKLNDPDNAFFKTVPSTYRI